MSELTILKNLLETTFSQGVETDWADLKRFLSDPKFPDRARKFKHELADAILNHKIEPPEFEMLTAIDQDSQKDVDMFLTDQIWNQLYPNESVSIPY